MDRNPLTRKGLVVGIILLLSMASTSLTCKSMNELVVETENNTFYYSYDELTELLQVMQFQHTDIFSYYSVGKTHKGRDIWLVKISDNVEINESGEPDVLYSGGMHGNEKPGYQNVIESMISIIENYTLPHVNESFTLRIRNIVNQSELFFIPMMNPDGCEANKRKNGRENTCILGKNLFSGVDIGRNFDYFWEDADEHPFRYILIPRTLEDFKFLMKQKNFYLFERSVVRYPLLDIGSLLKNGFYRGPYPFSEPESRAIKQVLENHSILIWLDYHIFGEEIRLPEVPKYSSENDSITFYSIAENISKLDGYKIFEPAKCLNQSGRPLEWTYANQNIFSVIIEVCPSMNPDVLYNKEFMSNVFEQHLYVNVYAAERAIEMTSRSMT